MESTTEFDLNSAIADWKETLAYSGNFNGDQIEELESHLMEEIDHLSSEKLNTEEVFMIAKKRIGSVHTLEKAYNPSSKLRFEKISWGLQALLFLFLFKEMTRLFTYFSGDLILRNDLVDTGLKFGLSIAAQVVAITLLILIFKRVLRLNQKYRDSLKPNLFMICALLSTFVLRVVYFVAVGNPAAMFEPIIVAQTMSFLPLVLAVLFIVFITISEYRKRNTGKIQTS
ncbi:MAG: hypothetical protein HEP71_14890 [Roseivirga sp.]|nr:hypothetical protein [Roseivirga sp.]